MANNELTLNPEIVKFSAGDTIKVHSLITEGEKERVQAAAQEETGKRDPFLGPCQ